jgi:predicted phosphohydrolase
MKTKPIQVFGEQFISYIKQIRSTVIDSVRRQQLLKTNGNSYLVSI